MYITFNSSNNIAIKPFTTIGLSDEIRKSNKEANERIFEALLHLP
jgi:hypothetical protein